MPFTLCYVEIFEQIKMDGSLGSAIVCRQTPEKESGNIKRGLAFMTFSFLNSILSILCFYK